MSAPQPPLNPTQTRLLLEQLGHSPNKKLGQNFLVDPNIVTKSLSIAQVQPGDDVVEIGPGLGTLTRALLDAHAQVFAVERDPRLHAHLDSTLSPHYPKLHLLLGDAVEHPLATFQASAGGAASTPNYPFKIVANLPYAITSPWLDAVLDGPLPLSMTLMLQEEAADRLTAQPGGKSIGALTIDVALAYQKSSIHRVPSQCFFPAPKVGSVLLHLTRLPQPRRLSATTRTFMRYAFTQRRKQIGSLLRNGDHPLLAAHHTALLTTARILPETRPEGISFAQWIDLDASISALETQQSSNDRDPQGE